MSAPLRILLLAPHPFFQERGTPIAVDLLVRALAQRGSLVDLVTYHEGTTPDYPPSVRVHRIPPTPFVSGIRPGFSWKKLVCDVRLATLAGRLAREGRHDLVHAVEEAVFIARGIGRRLGIPYLYDMDSSLPRQMAEKMPWLRPLLPAMTGIEARAIRDALAVVPMCDSLGELAGRLGAREVVVLRDISNLRREVSDVVGPLKGELGIRGTCYLYLGNLEAYQGIDLLLAAFRIVAGRDPDAGLVIAGGAPSHVARYRRKAEGLGIAGRVRFIGPWPLAGMADLFESADVLVSPRIAGENTPMKLYSYLASGRPVVATRLTTHTQAVGEDDAMLADPEPEAFAGAMLALTDADLRRRIGRRGRDLARERYSPEAFARTVNALYDRVEEALGRRPPA